MAWTDQLAMQAPQVTVVTSSDGGLPPEYYADRVTERLISVSATAPPEIRLQAEAYRDTIQLVVLRGIKAAIQSDHTTLAYQLRKAGMDDAAELVLKGF